MITAFRDQVRHARVARDVYRIALRGMVDRGDLPAGEAAASLRAVRHAVWTLEATAALWDVTAAPEGTHA